ncbi:MAG: DUF4132 domain-containing protein [Hydrogenophaga sp.]|nr:DUF4132 domain-containing protein [Hydrogenophaga sp.]
MTSSKATAQTPPLSTADIHATPDGQFHWSPANRQLLAQAQELPAPDEAGMTAPEQNRDFYASFRRAARLDQRLEVVELVQLLHCQPQAAFDVFRGLLSGMESAYEPMLRKSEYSKARKLLAIMMDWHDARLLDLLMIYDNEPMMQEALLNCVPRWPLYTLRYLLDQRTRHSGTFVVNNLRAHPDWLEHLRPTCSEAQLDRLNRLTTDIDWASWSATDQGGAHGNAAPAAHLPPDTPALLREPPWLRATKPTAKEKATQPWLKLPTKLPGVPHYIDTEKLAKPVLRESGLPLSSEPTQHLLQMLALCKPRQPYSGLAQVLPAFTPTSLAEMGRKLCLDWAVARYPTEHNWILLAQAWLGDTTTLEELKDDIADWPSEGAFGRAKLGLQVIADMGIYQQSDEALRALVRFAEKGKPSLRGPARQQIQIAAQGMGLSPDQLTDRLVPTLGLTEAQDWQFSLGQRHYTLHFDESLLPYVTDAKGTRLKDLPKPTTSEQAEDDVRRWKALKKSARTLASEQIARLELAMMGTRDWTRSDFERIFMQHPLLRLLGQRLLWVNTPPDGGGVTLFRLSEEFSPLNAQDEPVTLPDNTRITLAHPLEMTPEELAVWQQVWDDYRIVPPFEQLHRAVLRLTPEELTQPAHIVRQLDQPVAVGSLLGLLQKNWTRVGDGADVFGLRLALGEGASATVDLQEGFCVAVPNSTPVQHLREVGFHGPCTDRQRSEVLRTLSLLSPPTA